MTRSHTCAAGLTPTTCKHCLAGVPLRSKATAKSRGRCPHLGDDTGDRIPCDSCGGKVELKVLRCQIHSRCTVAKAVGGLKCCANCSDHPDARG